MYATKYLLINLLVIVLFYLTQARRIPKYVQLCKRSNPELNKCILNSIDKLRPHLLKGIPEMLIPPYDPLLIPKVELEQGYGPVSFKATFKNMLAHDFKDLVFKNVSVDLENLKIDMKLFLPTLKLASAYDIKGRILILPVTGNGLSQLNFTNVNVAFSTSGQSLVRKGQTYVSLKDKSITMSIKTASVYFGNLFNGNKELGDATNRFFNEHWKDILDEIRPLVQDTVAEVFYGIIKQVFDNFSLEQLVPY